jgi:1-acyl-sn-glycerol-3-phosphate acyltransferase
VLYVFLAKSEYFTGGGLLGLPRRAFFRAIGAVPVERDRQRDAWAALHTALEVLRTASAFGIYPEGPDPATGGSTGGGPESAGSR